MSVSHLVLDTMVHCELGSEGDLCGWTWLQPRDHHPIMRLWREGGHSRDSKGHDNQSIRSTHTNWSCFAGFELKVRRRPNP